MFRLFFFVLYRTILMLVSNSLHKSQRFMTKRKKHLSKLDRIERKCDRILSELLISRRQSRQSADVDILIDQLHGAARKLRMQCELERDNVRKMLNSNAGRYGC